MELSGTVVSWKDYDPSRTPVEFSMALFRLAQVKVAADGIQRIKERFGDLDAQAGAADPGQVREKEMQELRTLGKNVMFPALKAVQALLELVTAPKSPLLRYLDDGKNADVKTRFFAELSIYMANCVASGIPGIGAPVQHGSGADTQSFQVLDFVLPEKHVKLGRSPQVTKEWELRLNVLRCAVNWERLSQERQREQMRTAETEGFEDDGTAYTNDETRRLYDAKEAWQDHQDELMGNGRRGAGHGRTQTPADICSEAIWTHVTRLAAEAAPATE